MTEFLSRQSVERLTGLTPAQLQEILQKGGITYLDCAEGPRLRWCDLERFLALHHQMSTGEAQAQIAEALWGSMDFMNHQDEDISCRPEEAGKGAASNSSCCTCQGTATGKEN